MLREDQRNARHRLRVNFNVDVYGGEAGENSKPITAIVGGPPERPHRTWRTCCSQIQVTGLAIQKSVKECKFHKDGKMPTPKDGRNVQAKIMRSNMGSIYIILRMYRSSIDRPESPIVGRDGERDVISKNVSTRVCVRCVRQPFARVLTTVGS